MEELLDIIIQQNQKNSDSIQSMLDIIIQQNESNKPNEILDHILVKNEQISKTLNQTIKEGIGNLHAVLIKLDSKEVKEVDNTPLLDELKNSTDKLNSLLEFVSNKEDEKLSPYLDEIKARLTELGKKEAYSDKEVIKAIKELTSQIGDIDIPVFEFDFKRLADIQDKNVQKLLSHIFKVDIDKHQEPENALAVKIYDKDGDLIERFGGGGGGYPDVRLKNINNVAINPTTEETLQKIVDALGHYFISDKDDDASPNYYGFTDKDGNWYIMQETISAGNDTYRYVAGTSDYSTNWTNRASLSYDYFYNIF